MEDPNSRPAAAKLIDQVIRDDQQQYLQDVMAGEFRAGLSLCMQIYNALIKAGYLVEGCPCPYDCDGCHEGDEVCERGNPELFEEENGTV